MGFDLEVIFFSHHQTTFLTSFSKNDSMFSNLKHIFVYKMVKNIKKKAPTNISALELHHRNIIKTNPLKAYSARTTTYNCSVPSFPVPSLNSA